MKKQLIFPLMATVMIVVALCACSSTSTDVTPTTTSDGTTTNDFKKLYDKMNNLTSIDYSGSTSTIIKTNNIPDHKSPFFGVGNAKYEAYNGDNPNFSTKINLMGTISDPTLISRAYTFTIPRYPVVSSTHASTTGGAIGVARNGVVFFNQYNGVGALLDALEINNVDQYLGHPTPTNAGAQYHYHFEPKYLTKTHGNSSFLGFLLDGFPVYGPIENGKKITTADLDAYNGHVGPTEDYPNDKIYHYHVISATSNTSAELLKAAPWINGGKYYGTKGTAN